MQKQGLNTCIADEQLCVSQTQLLQRVTERTAASLFSRQGAHTGALTLPLRRLSDHRHTGGDNQRSGMRISVGEV
jgi:hypothetical protein